MYSKAKLDTDSLWTISIVLSVHKNRYKCEFGWIFCYTEFLLEPKTMHNGTYRLESGLHKLL